ncbi:MAG: phosphohistidine phosphatase, partial [Betaproteobacteria bacterium]|nr:phosphohistidine phosphatase [Betaproteobacteria bacterium]
GFYTSRMELILLRHAYEEEGAPDLERRLTKKVRKQAARVAEWLLEHLPKDFSVLASPAARAQETAEALGAKIRTVDRLAPGASVKAILQAAGWPDGDGTVIVVGHQPDLGETAAHVCGVDAGWPVKKGGLWWFVASHPVEVRAVISPDLLED